VKILFGIVLLAVGSVAAPAYAADNCIVSQEQLPGGSAAADTAKAKITCVYSCPGGKKVTQTIDMSQKKCPATIPAPAAIPAEKKKL
jgi:hypothetical protein